jgi:hypothetical protein
MNVKKSKMKILSNLVQGSVFLTTKAVTAALSFIVKSFDVSMIKSSFSRMHVEYDVKHYIHTVWKRDDNIW